MSMKTFTKESKEALEYVEHIGGHISGLEGATEAHRKMFYEGLELMRNAVDLLKAKQPVPPRKVLPPEDPQPEDGPNVNYVMNLEGTFKEAKGRVVADFAENYADYLARITEDSAVKSAKIAGLEQ